MHTKQLSKDNLILENTGTICSPPQNVSQNTRDTPAKRAVLA